MKKKKTPSAEYIRRHGWYVSQKRNLCFDTITEKVYKMPDGRMYVITRHPATGKEVVSNVIKNYY